MTETCACQKKQVACAMLLPLSHCTKQSDSSLKCHTQRFHEVQRFSSEVGALKKPIPSASVASLTMVEEEKWCKSYQKWGTENATVWKLCAERKKSAEKGVVCDSVYKWYPGQISLQKRMCVVWYPGWRSLQKEHSSVSARGWGIMTSGHISALRCGGGCRVLQRNYKPPQHVTNAWAVPCMSYVPVKHKNARESENKERITNKYL